MPRGVRTQIPDWVTHELVCGLFYYDQESGVLYWKVDTQYRKLKGKPAGHLGKKGYIEVGLPGGLRVKAHRLIWFIVHGKWPPEDLDHEDGRRARNLLDNLRYANRSQNNINRPPSKASTSGVTGVARTPAGKWRAYITVERKQLHLGHYDEMEAAVIARRDGEVKFYPGFSWSQA